MEFCVHGDILAHINKPLAEVSSTKRQQWALQVCDLTHTLTTHVPAFTIDLQPAYVACALHIHSSSRLTWMLSTDHAHRSLKA